MILEAGFFAVAIWWTYRQVAQMAPRAGKKSVTASPISPQLDHLTKYAGRLYAERQYLSAEKAYLKVLKLDHKNQVAYSRLGMIYLALKNYPDAIECFGIAAQLAPSASAYYNLGLAYSENRNNVKAIAMIEKAIMFEPTATRYTGLAKAYQKMSNLSKAAWSLEKAVALEPTKKHLSELAELYVALHERQKASETYGRILELDPTDAKARRLAGKSAVSN